MQSIGGVFGAKDEELESTLNEWGEEGWEAVSVFAASNVGKATIVARRPLTRATRRQRSMPG